MQGDNREFVGTGVGLEIVIRCCWQDAAQISPTRAHALRSKEIEEEDDEELDYTRQSGGEKQHRSREAFEQLKSLARTDFDLVRAAPFSALILASLLV